MFQTNIQNCPPIQLRASYVEVHIGLPIKVALPLRNYNSRRKYKINHPPSSAFYANITANHPNPIQFLSKFLDSLKIIVFF